MRVLQLSPGTGHYFCGSCLRDSALVRGLSARGHDAVLVPLYLPLELEREDETPTNGRVHMGGINMYLQHKLPILRLVPRFVARLLDRPGLLRWAASHGNMTEAPDLGPMTVSMMRGEHGRQAHELGKLVDWMEHLPHPDVVCLSNVMLAGMARSVKDALGVPVVATLQGEAPFLDGLPDPHREEAWSVLRERARDVDAFVAVSRWYADEMRARLELPEASVHVVLNGIDAAELADHPAPRPALPTIGYLSRMCAGKGLPTLVEAFLELKRRDSVPGLRLRVCGAQLVEDRRPTQALVRRVADAGHAADLDVMPNVDRATKLDFLRSLSVLSVPATYGESFGLYVLEALAAGVPVVQPRHGAFPELLEATGGGLLCEPDDPRDLADQLERVLQDEALASGCAERGRRAVLERFTEARMAEGFEAALSAVLACDEQARRE